MKNIILIYSLIFISFSLSAQQIGKNEKGSFLLQNATIVTVTKGTVKGDVLISDGIIAQIGQGLQAKNAKVIDCSDHFIYPGFIDGGTHLGLSEVGAVSLTNDYNEIGDFTPHMQALTAVNPNSVSIPVTRVNGVTTVIAKPSGGKFPGTAALIDLVGYTPEQMYAGFKAPLFNFPSSGKRGRWDRRSAEDIKKDGEKSAKKLNEIWTQIELYAKIDSAGTSKGKKADGYHPEMQAMMPVVKGEAPLLVEVNKESDIKAAMKWVKEKKIPKVIFTGVSDGWRLAKELAEAKIPVITGPVLSRPSRGSDKYDVPYRNAAVMQQAGVKVAIRSNDTENVRNLPFNAGFAATYGMGKEEALKAITIHPAEIFGLGDKYGSIEEGKIANILVTTGDPFEMKTRITHIFIRGWQVPVESRHTLLYEEFLERSPGLKMEK